MRRRYRCDCGVTVELEPRVLAPDVVTYDVPRCARCPGLPELRIVWPRVYEATHQGLDDFVRDHGPACADMQCEHEHCASVRKLYAMVQAAA